MTMWVLNGWAHLCFMDLDDDGVFKQFRGHVIDDITKEASGIIGQRVDYEDPCHNDCLDADVFYRVICKDYHDNGCATLLARRRAGNDAAGIFTDASDDEQHNHGQTFVFETYQFLAGDKAQAHCSKYLPGLPQEAKAIASKRVLYSSLHAEFGKLDQQVKRLQKNLQETSEQVPAFRKMNVLHTSM
ncbi:hypothetical protein EC973_009400 [Apophysomyces ossiformis]|uniref:Uncharacterized protein n=1 Tax=Apophysomyces ossiformis TaxID=679940 RepID=A0A8H7ET15_9FUNG|nr:hypothetical protein EC973_009400 [Apophysomyces ossiformis]